MQSVLSRDLKESLDTRKQVEIFSDFLRTTRKPTLQFSQKQSSNYKDSLIRITSTPVKEESRKPRISCRQAFDALSRQWYEETFVLSSTTEICSHNAYLEIINMGDKVLPFILEDLQKSPNHWFSALRSITGSDPVLPEQRGRMKQMAKAWIDWGFENGYLNH